METSEYQNSLAPLTVHSLVAQVSNLADDSALKFLSGSQFFIALIAGVVMAFAFQFVLTNLSIATDISAGINPFENDNDNWGQAIRTIETRVGGWTVFIVNTALFIACFLAVKLTLIHNSGLGAIVAVVIWSVYFLVLLWTSSRAIGALAGAVGSTATSGLQGVIGTIAMALRGQSASQQIVHTVEASVEAVTKELQSSLTSERVRENLQDYISKLQLPKTDLKELPSQVAAMLGESNLPSSLQSVLSPELLDFLKSATSSNLQAGQLQEQLTRLLNTQANSSRSSESKAGLADRALPLIIDTLVAQLTKRTDLTDLDIQGITGQLNDLKQKLTDQARPVIDSLSQAVSSNGASQASIIQLDVEHYLLDSPSWYLRPDSLDRGFREVLYDPNADVKLVRQQLERLNRRFFVDTLNRREGLSPDPISDIADELELIRREVLDTVRAAEEQETLQTLRHQVETYLSSAPKDALNPEGIQQDFTALLVDPEASYETLGNRLLQFDRNTLMQILLAGRQDLSPEETEQILNALEAARDRFLNQSQETWNQLQAQASEFRQEVERYLRETNSTELTPESIQQTLQVLLQVPGGGLLAMQAGLGQLDRSSLEQILAERQDLDPQQVTQLIEQVEAGRDVLLHAPQALTEQAKTQFDRLTHQITDYLRNVNLNELNPEGIQRNLQKLLDDPQSGVQAVQEQLPDLDRNTLVRILSQRGDLSEAQINQLIDQIQDAIRHIVRIPQRWATRTRDQIRDFPTQLADYLRNTERAELNPNGIQRDLQLLLKHPQAGLEQFRDRVAHIDRGTLVALLSQREDISEEEANQIADHVIAVRDQATQQVQNVQDQVQDRIQSFTNSLFDRLRDSLNSLNRSELNYEGIQQDLRKLFDDPEAGLDALKERLSQFDRDTLVALLSTRTDLSEEQANQIVEQIEAARDSILHRTERLQAEAEKRVQTLKKKAKEQIKQTQKTVATAAWWLLGMAVTSAATAAIAGSLAAAL